jgi:hypothetical protein
MYRTVSINKMYWDCHVTVVRNEEPPDDKKDLWGKYEGEILEIRYSPEVHTNGLFYWLSVDCDRLYLLREELGLPRQPEYPFHITIGNVK